VTFQGDRARTGWNADETVLRPSDVRARFGQRWASEPLDAATIGGATIPAHVYATPLFVDAAPLPGSLAGCRGDVVYVASTSGFAYAIAANDFACPDGQAPTHGAIVWRTRLTNPGIGAFDGNMPVGTVSTPFIDLDARPPRMYVTSMDATAGWQVFALDLATGAILYGWPVTLNNAVLAPVNRNGPATFNPEAKHLSQRSALNLSPSGDRVYVSFGGYFDSAVGWIVAIDTTTAKIAAAFSAAPTTATIASGGMWGPGGAAIDEAGDVYGSTGNSPVDSLTEKGVWGQSVLHWSRDLELRGTFTPFNYCAMDRYDTDLAGSSPSLLPSLASAGTTTSHLVAFGGKQGTVYLLDRDRFPGGTDHRPACDEAHMDSSADGSLLPPGPQPQFGRRGPLNVFGPYTEDSSNLDLARMRSSVAQFRDAAGRQLLFASGTTKKTDSSGKILRDPKPPCMVRLRIDTLGGASAYLAVDGVNPTVTFLNPGSPTVSSNGAADAIVWVVDQNGWRTDSLIGDPSKLPAPVLFAFDASTLELLYRSEPGVLHVGGKYTTATIAKGTVYVATDRVQAFGLAP
jgi:hypothetical protein